MSLTLQDIDSAERATRRVNEELDAIGRELYKLRAGSALGAAWGFDSYRRQRYNGPEYCGQEGPDWGAGTPIFSLLYYWPRAQDYQSITFPQGWLEQDWRALETERLSAERVAAEIEERADAEARARKREEDERRTYERLKAKFGGAS